ncbi:MAG: T9SS type A sorting domain-containing protein [candidate division Zixibacteria bacterium]|nr:T9SS type A sorting domain-containing protein [candidate division Zixibacteria bacterium]
MGELDTLKYDDDTATWYLCCPDEYGYDLFNVRFTPAWDYQLKSALFLFYYKTGNGAVRIYVWEDTSGYPAQKIDSVDVPHAHIQFYPDWTTVDFSSKNITFRSVSDFHVGYTPLGPPETDTVAIISDDGLPVGTEHRSIEFWGGAWGTMYDDWGLDVNFMIRAVVEKISDVECDTIPLHAGWQWISTNIDPNPCEMESLFGNCWNDLDIIIACDGSFCIPGVGCWIDCWNVSEMYKLHMAAVCTIQVCGNKVPTDDSIFLPEGWSCIPYFPECKLEPETAVVTIWDNLDILKNDDGEFCIPGVGCWIVCMEPNEGYKVHLSHADTLIYPTTCPPCPPPFAKKKSFQGFARTTHFNYLGNTGESYSIVVNSVDLNGKPPEVGDEIGVFTSSGLCVGGRVWQDDILGIAVWQNDDRTEVVDGFQTGEQIVFKLWDKSGNKEIELSISFERGDGRFGTDAYTLVNLKGVSAQQPEKFELAQNYPNPFNPETRIKYTVDSRQTHSIPITLKIYNILGQLVKTLVDEAQEPGRYEVIWDGKDEEGNDVVSGIYFYQLTTGEFSQTKKMILIK